MTRRTVIITAEGFQDHDLVYTYYRALEEGWEVDIATKDGRPIVGKYGIPLPMDKTAQPLISFADLDTEIYDAVILTGGHEAPDRVRQDKRATGFVARMAEEGKVVAGLCHGPWIMVSAGVLRGRKACAYVGLRDDVINAGAEVDFIPQLLARLERPPVVVRFENAFARVSAATFFHTGIVVADLAAAVAYYSDSLGVAFTEPGTFVIPRLEDPEPHPFELTAALSRTDPPYLELIQAAGDGIVSLAHAGGILYHGYWEPDMAARYHWLTTEGPGSPRHSGWNRVLCPSR